MHYFSALRALTATTEISGLPLNTNLGAYSPTLVVGDGEFHPEALTRLKHSSTLSLAHLLEPKLQRLRQISLIQRQPVPMEALLFNPQEQPRKPSVPPLPIGSGIGRSTVEPREPEVDTADSTAEEKSETTLEKRDLVGFNATVNFATRALTTSPELELRAGEGGSGVGITITPGASAGGGGKVGKRECTNFALLKIRSLGKSS